MNEKTTVQSSNSERITKALHSVWTSVQPWAQRNVTFGLVLAVCTEVPRWVFAFKAAHEPIWAGCALAILISYAAAHAWEEYFAQHDWLLLALNSLSLFFGVYTIAPVLYLMSSAKDHTTVALSDVFGSWFIGSWAIVLACTTFLPLIQVAVVEVRRRERAQRSVQPEVQPKPKKIAQPPADSVHPTTPIVQVLSEPIEDTLPIDSDDDMCDGAPDPSDKEAYVRWLYMEKGLTQSALATQFGVHRNTISKWLNGAAKVAS